MRRILLPLTVTLAAALFTGSVLAAPVSIPSGSKPVESEMWKHRKGRLEFSLGFEADYLANRDLKDPDAAITAGFYGVKFDFSLAAPKEHSFDLVLAVGKAYGVALEAVVGNNVVDVGLDDQLYVGGGVIQTFSFPAHKIQLMLNLMYRQMDAKDSDAEIANTQGEVNIDTTEWHAAFVIARKFEKATAYAGLRFSAITVDAEAEAGAASYTVDGAEADSGIGILVGVSVVLGRGFSVDVEARAGDEQAYTLGVNYTF
jgi:hypothetical protein